jgi:hypothetical protein
MPASLVRSLVLCLALLSAGCASTYRPHGAWGRSTAEIGRLELVNPSRSGIFIQAIDGHRTSARPLHYYDLAPGEHALLVRANVAFFSSGPQTVYLDVAPGAQYRVEAMTSSDAREWGIGIVDQATGQRVDRLWSNRSGMGSGSVGR